MNKSISGFTLIELLIVVVVIGILAGIAVPNYMNTKEKAMDREAIAALKIIQSAEKMYYAKYDIFYTPSSSIADINANLGLDLNANVWSYSIGGTTSAFTASSGSRSGRSWSISSAVTNATCSGSCL